MVLSTTDAKHCMLCKKSTNNPKSYKCGSRACHACLYEMANNGIKSYRCIKCSSNHRTKTESSLQAGTSVGSAPRVQKKHKSRGRWVLKGQDVTSHKPKSKIRNEGYTLVGFDYKKCTVKAKDKQFILKANKKILLENIDAELKGQKQICMCPIFGDKLLVGAKDMMYIFDLKGNLIKKHESSFPGNIVSVKCNRKYIYAVHDLRSKEGHLVQYDLEFNFMNDASFEHQCQSFDCTDTKVYYTEPFGFEWNYHTIIHVLNAKTLEQDDQIGYEYEEDGKYYCPKDNEDHPRTVAYDDRLYFLYNDYDSTKTTHRIDMADNDTLEYLGHFEMPRWFMGFRFDATGQFVNYFSEDEVFRVYSSNKRKLLGEFKLEEQPKKNQKFDYCCTNDGHLIVLRNNSILEIY